MTKATHRKIQLFFIALCVPLCGFYFHYYKKNREIDHYRLKLWAELKSHSITKEEYYRLWNPKMEEWKESFRKCELLELPVVLMSVLSGVNLIVYWQHKKNLSRLKAAS